jgi:kynurenine formamidase
MKGKNSKLIKLSYDISPAMPIFKGNHPNRIEMIDSFEQGKTWISFNLTLFNHNGTHIDAPYHFIRRGKKISDYHLDEMIFRKFKIVDVSKSAGAGITVDDLRHAARTKGKYDLFLIRTGFWSVYRLAEEFC